MYPLDTETCGFHSPMVLLQYAKSVETEERHLVHVWKQRCQDTIDILEEIAYEGVIGFNLAFDWFHIQKMYNMLLLCRDAFGKDAAPVAHLQDMAEMEEHARFGPCIKPTKAVDLMLYARKGPYQSTMDRKEIRVRKVPKPLAHALVFELERRLPIREVYFSRRKIKGAKRWKILDIMRPDGTIDPDFCDVVLKFQPSSALKAIVEDKYGIDTATFQDVIIEKSLRPVEYQWAPFATAVSTRAERWRVIQYGKLAGYAWPGVMIDHIAHWAVDKKAQQYARDDVKYVQWLYRDWQPEINDVDSQLACMVGSTRWRGFSLNLDKTRQELAKAREKSKKAPKEPKKVKAWLFEVMNQDELELYEELYKGSTKKTVLEALSTWTTTTQQLAVAETSMDDYDDFLAALDEDTGQPHPVAERAKLVLDARQAKFSADVYSKLIAAQRFHPNASVIGSFSGRMSGRSESKGSGRSEAGLNALGIGHGNDVRECFTFGDRGLELSGGDFVSYEICIAIANYGDEQLQRDVLTCYLCGHVRSLEDFTQPECPACGAFTYKCSTCGKESVSSPDGLSCGCSELAEIPDTREDTLMKFHGLFAQAMFPTKTYQEIIASKKTEDDLYDKGKRGGFSQLYGGDDGTLVTRVGIDERTAKETTERFKTRYEGVMLARKRIEDMFCSMRQPGGIGSQVIWHDPAPYIESMTGFRRDFTLENEVCKMLFDLANKVPPDWKEIKGSVCRRDRDQTVAGATMSALYAAAFNLQATNLRAAANHEIQSTGAVLCKELQARLWKLQPTGVSEWKISMMNIHDEIMAPMHPSLNEKAQEIIDNFIEEKRSLIPLLRIDWSFGLVDWSEK